jgi:glycerol-3-phosphate dehydrogenase
MPQYDVAIIGAGVIGALTARELSRYALRVALLERCSDVAQGTTKANSAIVHAGFDAKPGSLKAKMNVAGNRKMEGLCEVLHVPFHRNGSLVVAFAPEEMDTLKELLARGEANGVPGLRLLNAQELREMEPNVNLDATGALFAPTGGIVSPYELGIAAAECAVRNGVELLRGFRVDAIAQTGGGFTVTSKSGSICADWIINAAGVHSDEIARMIGDASFTILPRRGEYLLLDTAQGGYVSKTVFQCPGKMGKGVLITPTVHGNVLIGPSAEDIEEREDFSTTEKGLRGIQDAVRRSVPHFLVRDVITSFTGLRAHCDKDEFIIAPSATNPKMLLAAGIESPGLTAAPAIAEALAMMVYNGYDDLGGKAKWEAGRSEPVRLRELSTERRRAAVEKNPAYGRIICRCETVSEGEIVDAIRAPAGARDVDGVKRRTRAGMGRCQGGFCGTKVLEILARELNLSPEEVTKFGGESKILLQKTK